MADLPHAAGSLTVRLGNDIEAPDEETFDIFSRDFPSTNLGFIDPKAYQVEVSVVGKDYTIRQSPGLLSSNRKQGTTGAVVWRVTPLFAEWISSPQNILFHSGTLDSRSVVLELGAGISGLVGLALAPKIRRYIVTDQEYVLKLLQENIDANQPHWTSSSKSKGRAQRIKDVSNIDVLPLDWETSSMSKLYSQLDLDQEHKSIDALVSCDCIYNEALVEPLVQTSRDICSLAPADRLTICIVAQQLRSSEVFELWLESFHKYFRVWRVPDSILDVELQLENGFAVHIGVLRDEAGIKKQ